MSEQKDRLSAFLRRAEHDLVDLEIALSAAKADAWRLPDLEFSTSLAEDVTSLTGEIGRYRASVRTLLEKLEGDQRG
jgi:hypothetical protein